jgi:PII-like signaling protein
VLPKGPAKKVTIYINEDTRYHAGPLWSAVYEFLQHKRVSGATVLRPIEGFGANHHTHSFRMEATMEHMPIRIEFVDTAERVQEVLPNLYEMVRDGLIEVQDTTIIRDVKEEDADREPHHHVDQRAAAKMIRIFLGEADQWEGGTLYDAIVKRLRALDVAGATVYRGILGYGLKGRTHKDQFLSLHHDPPIMISVIDSEAKIETAIRAVSEMLVGGLIVLSDAEIVRVVRSLPPDVPPAGKS